MNNREYIVEYNHSNGTILYFVPIDMDNPDTVIPPNALIVSDSIRRTVSANLYSWKVDVESRCLVKVEIPEDCDDLNIYRSSLLSKFKSECNLALENYDGNYFDFEYKTFRLYNDGIIDIRANLETSNSRFVRDVAEKSGYDLEEFISSIEIKIARRNRFLSDLIGYYNTLKDKVEKANSKEELLEISWDREFKYEDYQVEIR